MVTRSSSLMLPVILLLTLTWVPCTESTTTKALIENVSSIASTTNPTTSTSNLVTTISNPANTTSNPVTTTSNPLSTTSNTGTTTRNVSATTATNTNTTNINTSPSTTVTAKPSTNTTQAPSETPSPSETTKSNTMAPSTPQPTTNATDSSTTSSTRPSTSTPINTTTTVSSINTSTSGSGSTTTLVTTQNASITPIVTTLNPNTTISSTQKPTTENPAVSSTNSTVSTTKPSTMAPITPNTTTAPNSTTPTLSQEVTTSTPKPTTSQSTSTVSQATTKSSTVNPITTSAAVRKTVIINEIMVDKDGGFQKIELQRTEELDITHYVMVVVDGRTNKTMSTIYLKDMTQQQKSSPYLVVTFNTSQTLPSLLDAGTGIAIYDTNMMTLNDDWTVSNMGLVDALVIGKTYSQISSHLTDVLTPNANPLILDPTKYGSAKTISRCSSDRVRSTDMYAFINPSFGADNSKKCDERFSQGSDFSVKLEIACHDLVTDERNKTNHSLTVEKLIGSVVKQVNMQCQCGVTSMHIQYPVIHCCDGPSVDMRFVAPNNDQVSELKESFEKFLQATTRLVIQQQIYKIDNTCSENCCNVDKHPHSHTADDDKAKNVKVTVAVIVTCLLVFMLVVLVVILYMKRKKSAVYQFRMSRLDEEDEFNVDGPDQEDFVGGQEATFDVKHR